jgi:hypothetical protein
MHRPNQIQSVSDGITIATFNGGLSPLVHGACERIQNYTAALPWVTVTNKVSMLITSGEDRASGLSPGSLICSRILKAVLSGAVGYKATSAWPPRSI